MDIAELFNLLESNQPQRVEDIKKRFHEIFNATRDSTFVNGMYDYFVQTSSIRSVEILVSVREPHDKYLFDRIDEGLKQVNKIQTLTLLGHVVRRQPPWLYKITQHALMRSLLKLLKTETEILPLMSALLVLIVLLPMIPALVGPFLGDIFEIFSRLAAWNCNNPGKFGEDQLVHLQMGMYALFLRLYGMYPCNFVSYLRKEYGLPDHMTIFTHTIKPMLSTVKMHPQLILANKDSEIDTTRWKKMGHHDVIVECAKYSLDSAERCREDSYTNLTTSFRSRSGTSSMFDSSSTYQLQLMKGTLANFTEKDFFSPTMFFQQSASPTHQDYSTPASVPQTPNAQNVSGQGFAITSVFASQEGTSPPEAAIEATPETTPVKDLRLLSSGRPAPTNSSVVRALNTFTATKWVNATSSTSTPTHSQPSSPMKKEMSPFKFPSDAGSFTSAFERPNRDYFSFEQRRESVVNQRINRLVYDRSLLNDSSTIDRANTTNLRSKTPVVHPTSPLRAISSESSVPNSPIPIEKTGPPRGVARPKPEKNGFRYESPVTQDSSQEDQEVLEIVRQGEQLRGTDETIQRSGVQNCDSVLQEFHPPHEEDYEQECEQQHGSPCTSGGLHMPNSQSMRDFAKRVHRYRYYSQCQPDSTNNKCSEFSTGSSPGDRSVFPDNVKVRRANSCPEMKKNNTLPQVEPLDKNLIESDELTGEEINNGKHITNGRNETNEDEEMNSRIDKNKEYSTTCVQTVESWPMPYEHLFLGLFPSVETVIETKSSPTSSPAPIEKSVRFSPHEMLDRYIEVAVQSCDRELRRGRVQGHDSDVKALKEQLDLVHLQLLFERHRREVHSERNRRLMGKAKSNRALEEHNSALRDQLILLQRDIENLNEQLEIRKSDSVTRENEQQKIIDYWKNLCTKLQEEKKKLLLKNEAIEIEMKELAARNDALNSNYQRSEGALLELRNEMQLAMSQALAGEQLKVEVELLQRELLLCGEVQHKYQERFSQLPLLKSRDDEIATITESYAEELKVLNQLLESKNSTMESCKARLADLENSVSKHDEMCVEQKRLLKIVKEEYQEQLNAMESKYKTQRAVIKRLEEHILELYIRIDRLEYQIRHPVRSPDSQSSGRDIVGAHCFSPHSSPPLSVSLTSSEGSMAFLQGATLSTEVKEIKNLQVIVDQPEQQVGISLPTNETGATGQYSVDKNNT